MTNKKKEDTFHIYKIPYRDCVVYGTIYPPGCWMGDDPQWNVFVGGGGVGSVDTWEEARELLEEKMIETFERRVHEAEAIADEAKSILKKYFRACPRERI